jgi:hypothetical protein
VQVVFADPTDPRAYAATREHLPHIDVAVAELSGIGFAWAHDRAGGAPTPASPELQVRDLSGGPTKGAASTSFALARRANCANARFRLLITAAEDSAWAGPLPGCWQRDPVPDVRRDDPRLHLYDLLRRKGSASRSRERLRALLRRDGPCTDVGRPGPGFRLRQNATQEGRPMRRRPSSSSPHTAGVILRQLLGVGSARRMAARFRTPLPALGQTFDAGMSIHFTSRSGGTSRY